MSGGDWTTLHTFLCSCMSLLSSFYQDPNDFSFTVLGDCLYEDLWRACAGTQINVPKIGQRVFYFIQGHIEQLQTLMGEVLDDQMPFFNTPSEILCRVVNSELKAEADTDQLYIEVTLLPESHQTAHLIPEPCIPEPSRPAIQSFCKNLTTSDIRGHDGFFIPHDHAIECLPPLDMLQTNPSQELVARDLHGNQWKFKHVYKGEPRRHFLTTGWNKFVRAKKLIPGDSFIFLRGEGAELCVGVRHAQVQCMGKKSPISSRSMNLQTLATATCALSTRDIFTVYYMPRLSEFIISVNKYLQAVGNANTTGMKFRMSFDDENIPDNSFLGTIAGIGDSSPWMGSLWKSLKVQWDEAETIHRPLRVSPWDVELIKPTWSSPQAAVVNHTSHDLSEETSIVVSEGMNAVANAVLSASMLGNKGEEKQPGVSGDGDSRTFRLFGIDIYTKNE